MPNPNMSDGGKQPIVCLPKTLPREMWVPAAHKAIAVNPMNRPPVEQLTMTLQGFVPAPDHLAVLTTKYWKNGGVHLTVGFLDNPPADLRAKIIAHMNAWNKTADVTFAETQTDPQVRIARVEDDGYWSYVGTDILTIAKDQPTMNLEGFTMDTEDSEFFRVVRHETGHTLGFPHEHMRKDLVDLIDPDKAVAFFGKTQGWNPEMVRQQVLTPIEQSSLWGTDHSDPDSVMCYQIPGTVTRNGEPITGGTDIDPLDFEFAQKIYPKRAAATA